MCCLYWFSNNCTINGCMWRCDIENAYHIVNGSSLHDHTVEAEVDFGIGNECDRRAVDPFQTTRLVVTCQIWTSTWWQYKGGNIKAILSRWQYKGNFNNN